MPTARFVPSAAGSPREPVGQFDQPMDVALSPTGDLLYVVDTYNHRVQVLCLGSEREVSGAARRRRGRPAGLERQLSVRGQRDQTDTGGVDTPDTDGVGDACQCGDVDDDARVTIADLEAIRLELALPGSLASTARCSVAGGTDCAVEDLAVLTRRLSRLQPKLENLCIAAGQSGP